MGSGRMSLPSMVPTGEALLLFAAETWFVNKLLVLGNVSFKEEKSELRGRQVMIG